MKIRPPEKSSYFSIGKVTHHNETFQVFHLGRPSMRIRPSEKSYFSDGKITHHNEILRIFHHWAGCLKQLDHLRNSSYFSPSGRSLVIIRLDHLRNSLYFSLSSRSLGTIRSLLKNLCIFHHRVGSLEQLNHFQKIFVFFTIKQVAWNN
jgi:hypothetical protein